jgi:DNA helicase-2/ATP-dependent DNA helicase PcrA
MSRIMEEYLKEGRKERDLETAVKLIEQGKMTEEEVAEFYKFTKAQMKVEYHEPKQITEEETGQMFSDFLSTLKAKM